MTVDLTPHSRASKGLAVASIRKDSIAIGELFGGDGSYPVSWVVRATRADLNDHEPVISEETWFATIGVDAPERVEAGETVDGTVVDPQPLRPQPNER